MTIESQDNGYWIWILDIWYPANRLRIPMPTPADTGIRDTAGIPDTESGYRFRYWLTDNYYWCGNHFQAQKYQSEKPVPSPRNIPQNQTSSVSWDGGAIGHRRHRALPTMADQKIFQFKISQKFASLTNPGPMTKPEIPELLNPWPPEGATELPTQKRQKICKQRL